MVIFPSLSLTLEFFILILHVSKVFVYKLNERVKSRSICINMII